MCSRRPRSNQELQVYNNIVVTLDCLDNTKKLFTKFTSTVKTKAASTGIQL